MRLLSFDIVIPFHAWEQRKPGHSGRKSKGIRPQSSDGQPSSSHIPPRQLPRSRGEAASSKWLIATSFRARRKDQGVNRSRGSCCLRLGTFVTAQMDVHQRHAKRCICIGVCKSIRPKHTSRRFTERSGDTESPQIFPRRFNKIHSVSIIATWLTCHSQWGVKLLKREILHLRLDACYLLCYQYQREFHNNCAATLLRRAICRYYIRCSRLRLRLLGRQGDAVRESRQQVARRFARCCESCKSCKDMHGRR